MKSGRSVPSLFFRVGMYILAAALVVFLFSNRNFRAILGMRGEIKELREMVDALKEENVKLNEEITALKNDPAYIEALARRELGLIRPGETEYRFIEGKK